MLLLTLMLLLLLLLQLLLQQLLLLLLLPLLVNILLQSVIAPLTIGDCPAHHAASTSWYPTDCAAATAW